MVVVANQTSRRSCDGCGGQPNMSWYWQWLAIQVIWWLWLSFVPVVMT